jgi:hypothetical protein
MLAGVLVLATGCVGDRVTYVQRAYPVTVQAPEPPPPSPPLVVMPPPPMVELPPAPPPAPVVVMHSAAELDRMLAPIALYPDPLLAQLLPAATLPAQIVLADRYLREGGDMNQLDAQPWDNSLKALARYPATVKMLDDNLAWTTDLGQAFLNQPADVMDSIQRLRAQARALGNLVSTPQQTVVVDDGLIEIVPAAPQVIYVPVYQPEVVYVQRPPEPGRLYVSFGAGLVVGAWLNHDCDWHAHEVIVWHQDHPRPADWWYHPANRREAPKVVNNVTMVNNTTIVNQNFTVWRPRAAGAVADRGDRGWGQQDVRVPTPARNEGARPARADVRPAPVVAATPKPVPAKEDRTAPPVKEARPRQPEVQRPPARAPEPLPNAPREAVKPTPLVTSREVVVAPPTKETPPARAPQPRANPPREAAKPTPVVPTREVSVVPPAKETPPAQVPPREASTVKPPVDTAPAPATTRPTTGQQAAARAAIPAPRSSQPLPAPKDTRTVAAPVSPRQPAVVASAPRPAAPQATPPPAVIAPVRPPSGALAGIESSRVTREASARGQQSREAMAKPTAPVRPTPAPVTSPKANVAEPKQPQRSR